MWNRWRRIGLVAVGLFAITVVARLISRFWAHDNEGRQDRLAWIAFGGVALLIAVVFYLWGRRYPMGQVALDLAGAALVGCLLSVLVGPFISGGSPFKGGAGNFFAGIWLYAAFAIGGALLGMIALMAAGQDYRSQALKRYAEMAKARPRRPVKR
jgi:predicted membrane channel-forming protein YqfA (hemolysin III family)